MALVDRIEEALKSAMISQDADQTGVLRLIKSSLKNESIKLGHDLTDDEAAKVLQREAKQRRDSIEAFNAGGRADLAKTEEVELAIIAEYLPKQMSEAELRAIIDEVIAKAGDQAQMGAMMGQVMAQVAGKADGGTVSRLVKERLAGS